jgi:hypothetical protein
MKRVRHLRLLPLPLLLLLVFAFAAASGARDRGADGEFEKRTSSHFVLYQDVDIDETSGLRGSRRFEQQVLKTLESAYDRLGEYLGLRPSRPITVVIYDPDVFDARFAGRFAFPIAGFYQGTVHVRGGARMSDQLVRVLHHELVHAALAAEAPSLVIPAWLNEGLAEWFDARAVGQRLLSARQYGLLVKNARSGRLYTLDDLSRPNLAHLGPRSAHLAYLQSHAFVEFLVRNHGERTLRELCLGYMRTKNLERSLRRSYRVSLARLEERFHKELVGASN